jgi:hypothetical protein
LGIVAVLVPVVMLVSVPSAARLRAEAVACVAIQESNVAEILFMALAQSQIPDYDYEHDYEHEHEIAAIP